MDSERLQAELAALRQQLAATTAENAALRAERDRLASAIELLLPPPTEAELRDAEANAGRLDVLIDEIEAGRYANGR